MQKAAIIVNSFISKLIFFAAFLLLSKLDCPSQCLTNSQFYQELITVEKSSILSSADKLKQILRLQKKFDQCGLNKDSVYARLLHRIGALQYAIGNLNDAINYTIQSVAVNSSSKRETNRKYTIRSYCNLGTFYKELSQYKSALACFDKCTIEGKKFNDLEFLPDEIDARINKGYIYCQIGDYQKAVEELTLGLEMASALQDGNGILKLLNERAEAYAGMKSFDQAGTDADKALSIIEKNDYYGLANNYRVRAVVSEAKNNYRGAEDYYKRAIISRAKTGDSVALAKDYLDAGNSLRAEKIAGRPIEFSKVIDYYTRSLQFARKVGGHIIAGKALNNLGEISFRNKKYFVALNEYQNSLLQIFSSFQSNNLLDNPTYIQCTSANDKNFLSLLLANKAECLLYLYRQTGNKQYLSSALRTARLTDSLITDMRHEQTGEQSKLFWRDATREFFSNAIEASYWAKDATWAFFLHGKKQGSFT